MSRQFLRNKTSKMALLSNFSLSVPGEADDLSQHMAAAGQNTNEKGCEVSLTGERKKA